jgi:hypothetical protein
LPVALAARFWESKPLEAMDRDEWEALCDGCGKCCLHKLEDVDTGILYWTNVACRLLDRVSCTCRDYPDRHRQVPDCVQLTPENLATIDWLPETCAYRRVAAGQGLPDWHPLLSGDCGSVRHGGHSVSGWCVSEQSTDDHWNHLVDPEWIHSMR